MSCISDVLDQAGAEPQRSSYPRLSFPAAFAGWKYGRRHPSAVHDQALQDKFRSVSADIHSNTQSRDYKHDMGSVSGLEVRAASWANHEPFLAQYMTVVAFETGSSSRTWVASHAIIRVVWTSRWGRRLAVDSRHHTLFDLLASSHITSV